MNTTILISGAPGNVGTEVVQALIGQANIRVAAYDIQRARARLGENVEIVHFDFLDSTTFEQTFDGVDRMFLVRPPTLANVEHDIAPALRAAKNAGVRYIVFLSLQGVENNRIVPHHKIETLIREMGFRYTFLRASFFMQNLSTVHRTEIQNEDRISVPVGLAKTSFIDVRDIAAVAAHFLIEPEGADKAYTLTGAEALNYTEVSGILTSVLGRPIRYDRPSIIRFVWEQVRAGRKLGYTLIMAALYTLTRFGNAKAVTPDVQAILHRNPISFSQFAQDYKQVWARSAHGPY